MQNSEFKAGEQEQSEKLHWQFSEVQYFYIHKHVIQTYIYTYFNKLIYAHIISGFQLLADKNGSMVKYINTQ